MLYSELCLVTLSSILKTDKNEGMTQMKYLHIRLEELLTENGLTKKKVCSALEIDRSNFNRYYRDEFQRIDANLLLKLCDYFQCTPGDLLEIREKE